MNINAKSSSLNNNNQVNAKPVESVETAGSLAFVNPFSYFSVNTYDSFDSSNPFAGTIDYSNYSDIGGETVATSSFMSGFASAVATIGASSSTGSSGAACCASAGGGFSGGGCSSGGFSSFV